MIRNFHRTGGTSVLKTIASTCIFTILLVGTLQATHIHKEWNAPSGPDATVRAMNGQDAQCVFCLSSHAAVDIPLLVLSEPILSSAAETPSETTAYFPALSVDTETIRPPPMA